MSPRAPLCKNGASPVTTPHRSHRNATKRRLPRGQKEPTSGMCNPHNNMDSDLADAKEIKAEESAWEASRASACRSTPSTLTHYKNNPESFKNEVLSGITVAVMQVRVGRV